jgi:heme oxygenase
MFRAGPVLTLLREETGEVHRRLEARMDAITRLADPDTRDDLVQRYHRFHEAVEAAVSPLADDLDLTEWRRLPLLEDALTLLGLAPLPSSPRPSLASREQALGALYVLKGSALGGRVILKDLAGRGADPTGLGFLDPHGEDVGDAWRAFIIVLEREVTNPGQAALGALAAFAHAEDILCLEVAA